MPLQLELSVIFISLRLQHTCRNAMLALPLILTLFQDNDATLRLRAAAKMVKVAFGLHLEPSSFVITLTTTHGALSVLCTAAFLPERCFSLYSADCWLTPLMAAILSLPLHSNQNPEHAVTVTGMSIALQALERLVAKANGDELDDEEDDTQRMMVIVKRAAEIRPSVVVGLRELAEFFTNQMTNITDELRWPGGSNAYA